MIERRYDEAFSQTNTPEKVTRKKQLRRELSDKLTGESDEAILVEEFMNGFGDISKLTYDYRYGILSISWMIMEDDGGEEISVEVSMMNSNRPPSLNDLNDLEVESLRYNHLFEDQQIISSDEFIGSD